MAVFGWVVLSLLCVRNWQAQTQDPSRYHKTKEPVPWVGGRGRRRKPKG